MRWLRFRLILAELVAATHLRAAGAWWQAAARRRLGKFSGERAAPLSGAECDLCAKRRGGGAQ